MIKLGFLCLNFILFFSCSLSPLTREGGSDLKNSKKVDHFIFKDPSGEYILKREVLSSKSKVKVRQTLYSPDDMNNALEKSVTINQYGTVGTSKELAIRPIVSQFSIWFEKEKFFSQLKLNMSKKKFDIYLDSPEEKWKGKSESNPLKGTKFCWFSQLPECLKRIINNSKKAKFISGFIVVWDSFPYYNEQYQKLSGKLYSPASVKFDGEYGKTFRFSIELEGQIIFYHYDKNLTFQKMVWVSQGITVEKND